VETGALNVVRRDPSSFSNVSPADAAPAKLVGLRATVKRVCLHKASYDLDGFRFDNISKLLSGGVIPRFEVEVASPPPTVAAPRPPTPPGFVQQH
jgi:hypothetical protein